jgi:hypothetical protein
MALRPTAAVHESASSPLPPLRWSHAAGPPCCIVASTESRMLQSYCLPESPRHMHDHELTMPIQSSERPRALGIELTSDAKSTNACASASMCPRGRAVERLLRELGVSAARSDLLALFHDQYRVDVGRIILYLRPGCLVDLQKALHACNLSLRDPCGVIITVVVALRPPTPWRCSLSQ